MKTNQQARVKNLSRYPGNAPISFTITPKDKRYVGIKINLVALVAMANPELFPSSNQAILQTDAEMLTHLAAIRLFPVICGSTSSTVSRAAARR